MKTLSRALLCPGRHRDEAEKAVKESQMSLVQARVNRALSQKRVSEIDSIVEQNNFGMHAARALRMNGVEE